MKTIRFYFAILGTAAVLLMTGCNNGSTSDGNPAGQSINDPSDKYEPDGDDKRPDGQQRSADTVDVKPMP